MADEYSFGIEIEISATPRNAAGGGCQAYYYEKFAQALAARGLPAKADDRAGAYRKHIEEYEKRWWITGDGSISSSGANSVELEAVSPILYTSKDWEGIIDKFWAAQNTIFHMPAKSASCGSHVHVAPGRRRRWTLQQLRNIAFGIACFEKQIAGLLPAERRDNEYCRGNTSSSQRLGSYYSATDGWRPLLSAVKELDRASLMILMQADRRVLWNFQPAADNGIGTIEFRGGRCLRGNVRTKRWIAFAVAYIHFLLQQKICSRGSIPEINSTSDLYYRIRRSAAELGLRRYLPTDHQVLNETKSNAARSQSDFDSSAFSRMPHFAGCYPAEPPPVYTARGRSGSPSSVLERGGAASASPQRRDDEDEESDACTSCLRSLVYVALRFLQVILAIAVLGMYLHAGNEGAIDSAGVNAGFAKVVSTMSLITSSVAIIYLGGLRLCRPEAIQQQKLIRRLWRYEWLIDLFLLYVSLLVLSVKIADAPTGN